MALKADNFYEYEAWDLAPASIPPRSRLFHLKPIGIGTAHTESCTSYIARLAAEHLITAGSLFTHELAPASKKSYLLPSKSKSIKSVLSTSFYPATPALNGLGNTARDWVEVLEKLTLQRGLRFLTMLRWQNVLTERSLSRSVRAWCPHCLEEQNQSGSPIYEYLLWALNTVHVCPVHETRLEDHCHRCDKQLRPLADRSLPGYCSRCDLWLGHANHKEKETSVDLRYELWVANQMGGLIAAAPKVEADPPKRRVSTFVPTCVNKITNGNGNAFARLIDINPITVYSWCRKNRPVPQTNLLLKVCYSIGVSFVDLLTKDDLSHDLESIDRSFNETQNVRSRLLHRRGEVKRALLAALEQDPAPSVRDVARRLGFKAEGPLRLKYPDLCKRLSARSRKYVFRRTTREFRRELMAALKRNPPPSVRELAQELGYKGEGLLRRACPDLCKMLTAKWRKVPGQRKQTRRAKRNHQDPSAMEKALQQALKETLPPSLAEIANRLGYVSAQCFRTKFPHLCEAIMERRAKSSVEHALQEALKEENPPSLSQIAENCGYACLSDFREKFSDLCDLIIARRAECRARFLNRLKMNLEAILVENPPPTLQAVSKRLGHKSTAILFLSYPDLSQAIAKRHATHCKAQFESIGTKLEEFLQENPPPTLRIAARRCGYAPEYLGDKFPKVCQAISKRYAQYRKKRSLEKKKQSKIRIRLLAMRLHVSGEHPSQSRIQEVSNGPIGLSPTELCAFLREVRRELGLSSYSELCGLLFLKLEAISCRRLLEALSCRGGKVLLQVTGSPVTC